MGRIKDVFIELQNKYGQDLEDMPKGFSMDEYLSSKSKETAALETVELFCEMVKRSKKTMAQK
jgi:hypothetical protein